jgi:Transglycosylase SLT domain
MKLKLVLLSSMVFLLLSVASMGQAGSPDYFFPSHRISGVGADRGDLSGDVLQVRTDLMIQAQTFGIMREQEAINGAHRVTDPKLQAIIHSAAESSGFPAKIIEAIIYLESWGDPKAESPAGPKGIMQIADATAHDMGLSIVRATRYKVTQEKVLIKTKSKSKNTKPKYRTVTHKEPYTVVVRDDRLIPERAIPAAAHYLAFLEKHFGGEDWAIFAYHCGTGCVTYMRDLTSRAQGIPPDEITVARMFFSCGPTWNRDLYQAIQQEMLRDYSPTYYFRIQRAAQLLALYRDNPEDLASLQQEYKNQFAAGPRAPHRLSAWLHPDDLVYRTESDIRSNTGDRLMKAADSAQYLGYTLQIPMLDSATANLLQAAPAALGTLTYIAFETRRLVDERSAGQTFQPLTVSALVEPESYAHAQASQHEAFAHTSGQVFDLDTSRLPASELEILKFVLDDLGWSGYLGFVEDGAGRLHIGCSPESREFFANIWQEAQEHLSAN